MSELVDLLRHAFRGPTTAERCARSAAPLASRTTPYVVGAGSIFPGAGARRTWLSISKGEHEMLVAILDGTYA